MNLCQQSGVSAFNVLSRFVIAFIPKNKRLNFMNAVTAVILEPTKIKSVIVSTISPSVCHEVMGLDAMTIF